MRNPELWARLETFEPGGDAFVQRLAERNGWTAEYAAEVLDEYRRFLYLAAVHDRPLAASPDIEKAWEQHLVYTHDYWRTLCRDMLGKELHYSPRLPEEAEELARQYETTRTYYAQEFGAAPPRAVWRADSDDWHAKIAGRLMWAALIGTLVCGGSALLGLPFVGWGALGFAVILVGAGAYRWRFRVRGRRAVARPRV